MDIFFKQLFLIPDYQNDQAEEINMFKSTFIECNELSNYDIDDLHFLCMKEDEDYVLFSFPNSQIVARYSFFDGLWDVPERHELVVGQRSTLDGVSLLPHSSSDIEYVLYPFEQCRDIPLSWLIPAKGTFLKESSLTQIYFSNSKCHHKIKWNNDLTLIVNESGNYNLLLNDKFLSGFKDDPTHFQPGDDCTIAYTDNNGNLIVCQHGDVTSVVIIKNKS